MDEISPTVFGIIDLLSTCCGNTLAGKFLYGNRMALYAFRPILASTRDEPSEYDGKEIVQIHMVQPQFIFNDPVLRSLVAEASSIFVTTQNIKSGTYKTYLQISRTYRSVIRACLIKLQDASNEAELEDSEKCAMYRHYISIFYSIECVWHLSEILLLDSTNKTNAIVPQLLEWVRFHFPAVERTATELLLEGQNASENEDYWPTLRGLIMHGQIEVTRTLLRLHPQAESVPFKMAEQILKNMPTFNSLGGFSLQRFQSLWRYWLSDTSLKLNSNIFEVEPRLQELIQLTMGDANAWNTHIRNSQHWYEFMPGFLFYTNPACKRCDLGVAAITWLERWSSLQNEDIQNLRLKYLDKIILSVMDSDIYEVILTIYLMGDNQWFITHLMDLLYNCGELKAAAKNNFNILVKLRDYLLYEYGSTLMNQDSLWQFGMDYLEFCTAGKHAWELLITKLPIKTEKHALRILDICSRKSLYEAKEEICKVQARKSLSRKRYGNALEWAVRSRDSFYVTAIADHILKHYVQTGEMLCQDLLANLGAKMFISARLIFLVKYYDFYEFYRTKNFLPAAELLINLLDSKIAPEYFWPSLLIDCIPLVESKDPKILSNETCSILQHLESDLLPLIEKRKKHLEQYPEDPVNILKDYRLENIEELVDLIRLACTRNMSRAIIFENTVDDNE